MNSTTFSYQSATTSYILNVDSKKTSVTARWLQSQGVKRFRSAVRGAIATFTVYAANISNAVVKRLNAKFNPVLAPVSKPVVETTFADVDGTFCLTVDTTKTLATAAWLTKQGCTFNRYVRAEAGTTVFRFICITNAAMTAITARYPLPEVEVAPVVNMTKATVVTTFTFKDSYCPCYELTVDVRKVEDTKRWLNNHNVEYTTQLTLNGWATTFAIADDDMSRDVYQRLSAKFGNPYPESDVAA